MKISLFRSKIVVINFFSINSTIFMIKRAFMMIYNLHLSFWPLKLIPILFKVRESISKVTFILILVNKKVFSENTNFLSLLSIKKKRLLFRIS